MKFTAEVLEARAKKQGLDKVILIKLETSDERALDLQRYIAQETVDVEIKE